MLAPFLNSQCIGSIHISCKTQSRQQVAALQDTLRRVISWDGGTHSQCGESLHRATGLCSNELMAAGKRVLAIDYGSKNIGLACSDDLGLTVRPLPSIPNSGKKDLIERLSAMISVYEIRELVLGMPVNMDGTRGDPAVRMEKLLQLLRNTFKIPATGVDERLSTVEAMDFWNVMSPRRRKKYRTIDSLAAALILERYLKEM